MTARHPALDVGLGLGSRVRTTPYFDSAVDAGVTHLSIYNHTLIPVSYGDPIAEYIRLTQAVSLWDVSCQRQIVLGGPDAGTLAQLLSTRDLRTMKVGQGKYAPMCDHNGLLLNDPLLLRRAEDEYWLSIADSDVLLWARAVAYERSLEVTVGELDVAPLAIQGPRAEETAAALLGEWVRTVGFFRYVPADVDGIPILVGRAGWSKQGGFELYLLDPSRGSELWDRVMAAGEPHGIGPGSPNPIERLESGLFSLRSDAPFDCDPFEVGLGKWLDLDSDVDFIGKRALLERRAGGLTRQLVNVDLGEATIPPLIRPAAASVDGAHVGWLRVGAQSIRLGAAIGLAFVDVPANSPGTELLVDIEGVEYAGVVISPFGDTL